MVLHTYMLKELYQSNTGTTAAPNNANKKIILKSYTPFTICISK